MVLYVGNYIRRRNMQENTGFLIKKISDRLLSELDYNLRKYDITARQLEVLDYIKENKNCSQKDLVEFFGIRHTTVIDLIKKLQEKKLINKKQNKENAKSSVITLTKKGQLLADELGNFRDDVENIIAKGLGKEDKKALIYSLNIVYQNICEYEKNRIEVKDI